MRARGTGIGLVVGGAALALAAGFATAKLHTEMARAPVLTKEMRGVTVKGWVELYELRDKARARITLRVIALGELPPEKAPCRVRVTLPAASAKVATGEAVSLKATLRPPPEPIAPHGFDFGRTAWFDRLGATGYGTGTIDALAGAGEAPLGLRLWAAIDRLRSLVNARIRASLPGERGQIAAALITGERAGISQDVNLAMRNSGLFHILSISGCTLSSWQAQCSGWSGPGWRSFHPSRSATPSGNGRRERRSPLPCSTCFSQAPRCPRFAPGS